MTPNDFRRMALSMDGVVGQAHMHHPDFRADGRIFATLGYPDREHGMVALTPDQQQLFVREHEALRPVKGAWGEKGATLVRLADVDAETLGEAMTLAWQNAMAKPPAKRKGPKAGSRR